MRAVVIALSAMTTGVGLLAGCQEVADACGSEVESSAQPLIGGEARPFVVPLSAGQQRAIGVLRGVKVRPRDQQCTAVLIAEGLLLSAAHCASYAPSIFVTAAQDRGVARAFGVVEFVAHPSSDVLLARLVSDESAAAIEPIPVLEEALGERWLGIVAQLAGTGSTEHRDLGALEFLAEVIVDVGEREVTVDGMGRSGACVGDSGGPLLVRGRDGAARVAGVLSHGARNCRGIDVYERVDVLAAWLREQAVPERTLTAEPSCGDIDAHGMCRAGTNLFCEAQRLRVEDCVDARHCGWDERQHGYRCVEAGRDPCSGSGALGSCEAGHVLRCEQGKLVTLDCSACGLDCGRDLQTGAAICVARDR